MDYQAHYDKLIERARSRTFDGYVERHHVVPRCIRETDVTVALTPEEHYVAHQLLAKMHPDNKSLAWALMCMTGQSRKLRRRNKIYGWVRRRFVRMVSRTTKGEPKSGAHRL